MGEYIVYTAMGDYRIFATSLSQAKWLVYNATAGRVDQSDMSVVRVS